MKVGGARARFPAGGPGRRPMLESRERGAIVEAWQLEPGGRVAETKLGVKTQVEPWDCRDQVTTQDQKGRA